MQTPLISALWEYSISFWCSQFSVSAFLSTKASPSRSGSMTAMNPLSKDESYSVSYYFVCLRNFSTMVAFPKSFHSIFACAFKLASED